MNKVYIPLGVDLDQCNGWENHLRAIIFISEKMKCLRRRMWLQVRISQEPKRITSVYCNKKVRFVIKETKLFKNQRERAQQS